MTDDHEICRRHIRKLEADLDAAHETVADLELDLAEKNDLIASMAAEIMRMNADRTYQVA